MSLEDSMAALAESNLKLAEAQNNLAEKYERILAGEANIDPAVVAGAAKAGKAETAAPAKKGPGRPKKDAPKAEPEDEGDDDGLGGEEEEENDAPTRTSDEVKDVLKEFKAAGGKPVDLMSKFGAKSFPDVKEADYDALYDMAVKATKKLA